MTETMLVLQNNIGRPLRLSCHPEVAISSHLRIKKILGSPLVFYRFIQPHFSLYSLNESIYSSESPRMRFDGGGCSAGGGARADSGLGNRVIADSYQEASMIPRVYRALSSASSSFASHHSPTPAHTASQAAQMSFSADWV